MGLLDIASYASVDRGHEYWQNGKVRTLRRESDTIFSGTVAGSGEHVYDVCIDAAHPRKGQCNCPHANGKRIVCKHQVALFFKAFPEEAAFYEQQQEEEIVAYENWLVKRDQLLRATILKMKKAELQQVLMMLIDEGPEWQLNRFLSVFAENTSSDN